MSNSLLSTLKRQIQGGYFYCNSKTILLVDHIARMPNWKLTFAVFLLACLSLAAAAMLARGPFQTEIFTPEQISLLSLPDTRIQSSFYTIFSASVFLFSLAAGLFTPTFFSTFTQTDWKISKKVPAWFLPWLGITFWVIIIALYEPKARDFLLALAAAYLMKEIIGGRFRTRTIFITFTIICLIYFLLPLLMTPKIMDGKLWGADIHWSAVLGEGLFHDPIDVSAFRAFSAYGIILSELVAQSRVLSFFESLAGTRSLLIVFDVGFLILVCLVIVCRIGKNNTRMVLASATLILLLFCGMLSGVFQYLDAPNLLPIRFLMIPLTVLLAFYLGELRTQYGCLIAGLFIPFFIFYNFEIGLSCILALGFAFFIKGLKDGLLVLLFSGMAAIITCAISGTVLVLLLFDQPLTVVVPELVEFALLKIQSGSSGYGGLSFYFFMPFILVVAHSMVLFSQYLTSIRDGQKITAVEFQSIVIVALIISIGPYVMNRFHVLNMWVPFLLYFLLVLPKLVNGKMRERKIWSFIVIVFIVPFILGNPTRYIFSKEFVATVSERLTSSISPCIDGVPASTELCHYTLKKAEELETLLATYPDLKWLSGVSLTMSRLTGTQPALEQKAIFFFAHLIETRNEVVGGLVDLQAPMLAFDKAIPGNVAGIPEVEEQFQRKLIQDAGYKITGQTEYWVLAQKEED